MLAVDDAKYFHFQLFNNNPECCWKIKPELCQTLVNLVTHYQERAPEFVQVLSAVITLDNNMTSILRRNQELIMKQFLENFPKIAHVFEFPANRRFSFFTSHFPCFLLGLIYILRNIQQIMCICPT